MTAEDVVTVEDLRKVYVLRGGLRRRRELVAVAGSTFSVAAGGSLAVVGESGSGKSTTARMLVGLETPTAGRIVVAGREHGSGRITGGERRRRARDIQMVFQNPYASLDPRQSVSSCIASVLRLHFPERDDHWRRERIQRLLDQVGLDERQGRALPRHLSGGQRQRVAIARALAAEPRVLVLDEAVSALDVSIQAQVLNMLRDIREEVDIAYLFVSHDLAVVRQISDEVIVMREGEIVERGRTEDVLDRPQHPYTRLLIDSVPRPGWRPRRVVGV
ncbi:ATP-binding cassette domain-containing protein [Nocardioides humi]|uniref:ATP-binding cassette domain-containing protein n=1 Tax=Nocardioides humi TaxID=449461 RepID=UPI001FE6DFB1|nr:ATP-binding cassette domain-containing protein [Nocardioides humi]